MPCHAARKDNTARRPIQPPQALAPKPTAVYPSDQLCPDCYKEQAEQEKPDAKPGDRDREARAAMAPKQIAASASGGAAEEEWDKGNLFVFLQEM